MSPLSSPKDRGEQNMTFSTAADELEPVAEPSVAARNASSTDKIIGIESVAEEPLSMNADLAARMESAPAMTDQERREQRKALKRLRRMRQRMRKGSE